MLNQGAIVSGKFLRKEGFPELVDRKATEGVGKVQVAT